MNRFIMNVSLTVLTVVPSLLSASNAFAATTCTTTQGVVTIIDPTSCHYETAGGCTSLCTPVNFTATCDGTCSATATTTCSDTCQTTCNTECTTAPATFVCKDYCVPDCEAGCSAKCTGDTCVTDCSASCDTHCTETCAVHPGATDCTTLCQDSCSGTCTVEADMQCKMDCTTALTGGCTTKCAEPSGGLFCDGQFIDINAVTDCDFKFNVAVAGKVKTACSVVEGPSAPFGIPAGLAMMAGLGLTLARRRRQS